MTLNDHPSVGQGRQPQHHHPKANRDALLGLSLLVLPWLVIALAVWLWASWGTYW